MLDYNFIQTNTKGRVFTLTINRPEVMNAISPQLSEEMAGALDDFEQNDELWVAIITGAGDVAFSAGGDINAMAASEVAEDYQMPATGYGGMTSRYSSVKPIIAAVNGIAFGGGFEVALAADIIVASDNAVFGLPEPKIGAAAVAGGMHRLVREIGLKPAMNLLLTAQSIDAHRAKELGLVAEVTTQAELLPMAEKVAERICRCSPLAVRASKQCVMGGLNYAGVPEAQAAQDAGEFPALDTMLKSQDIREGLNAFLEKRKPVWKGK